MPDYKRFIAYFYEYIDGKRQRNAGFVKAELRGSVWRISLQLKGRRWPEESLEIYGYRVGKKRYPVTRLAKGYPLKDCLIQKFQLPESWADGAGNHFEELEGMWIPCGEKRCFISHWGEGEAEPEKLGITADLEAAECQMGETISDTLEEQPKEEFSGGSQAWPVEECFAFSHAAARTPEAFLKKPSETRAEMEALKLRREPQECLDDMKRVLSGGREKECPEMAEREKEEERPAMTEKEKEEEPPAMTEKEKEEERPAMPEQENKEGCPAMPEQENKKGCPVMPEQEQEEERPAVTEQEQEERSAMTKQEKEEEQPEAEERKKNSGQDRVWEMLKKHHPAVCPLRNMEGECVAICPRDVLWLRQQGWPVGRNSFLIQGFSQYRHLLLCRRKDGSYILGVPGKENPQIQNIARAFGYGEFEKSGQGEDFGYWCRKILLEE